MFTAICLFAFTASPAASFHRGDNVISHLRRRIVESSSQLRCHVFRLYFLCELGNKPLLIFTHIVVLD